MYLELFICIFAPSPSKVSISSLKLTLIKRSTTKFNKIKGIYDYNYNIKLVKVKMNTDKFQKDYKWVIKLLNSCVSIEQLDTMNRVFDLFIKKWAKNLSENQILLIHTIFKKYFKLQKRKIKKNLY